MRPPDVRGIDRVIVVVIDGVRADATALFHLAELERLAAEGASTFHAETVRPSVTAAAMGSLFTGVRPDVHGLTSDRFRMPRPRAPLAPLPLALQRAGIPTWAFLARVPRPYRPLARHFTRVLGVAGATFHGDGATDILEAAKPTLAARRRGLFFFHWPDADRAGHAAGWTSRGYAAALRRVDESLGALDRLTGASADDGTLLIAVADHGGGGAVANDHDSDHVHDRRIPLVLAGGAVRPVTLSGHVSLLDVPATVVWAFGLDVPPSWAGRPLREAVRVSASAPCEVRPGFVIEHEAGHETITAACVA